MSEETGRWWAAAAIVAGVTLGVALFLSIPSFAAFVQGVMAFLKGFATVQPQHPGFLLSLAAALLVGLSMNFLPCNLPIVMTLIPATAGGKNGGQILRINAAYAVGGVIVLATLGFLLGLFGSALKPFIQSYGSIGPFTAGIVLGGIGILTVLWGLQEFDLLSLPRFRLPFANALRKSAEEQEGLKQYVMLGAVYSGATGGCPMPTYQLLLLWVVVSANPVYGAVLLSVYVIGRILPVAIIGAGLNAGPEDVSSIFKGKYGALKTVNGVILLVLGSFLLTFMGLRILAQVM
ncbi:MAG: sulfite exporter TauE/SafE family protein [Candidatus Nanohaloarchaea archaeon]